MTEGCVKINIARKMHIFIYFAILLIKPFIIQKILLIPNEIFNSHYNIKQQNEPHSQILN